MKNNPDEFKTTSFSIRLDIPDTDLRERDISYLIDKALRPIIDDNKFENVEIDVVDITERT
jgi:ribonuclease PH